VKGAVRDLEHVGPPCEKNRQVRRERYDDGDDDCRGDCAQDRASNERLFRLAGILSADIHAHHGRDCRAEGSRQNEGYLTDVVRDALAVQHDGPVFLDFAVD